jgi:O-antigen ligase
VTALRICTRAERRLLKAQRAIEDASWRDLFGLAAAAIAVGALSALGGAYFLGFLFICAPLAVLAYRSSAAACVLVALTAPVVALGSLDVGFHLVPAYVFIAAGLSGVVRRAEWRTLRPTIADLLLVAFLLVAVAATVANLGRVPATTVVDASGANDRDIRWLAQTVALGAMAGLYLLMRTTTRSEERLAAPLRALLVATVFVGAYALYQIVGRELDLPFTFVNERRSLETLPSNSRYIRVNGTLSEASPLAQFSAIALCLGTAWLVAGARRPTWLNRRVALLSTAGGAAIVFATLSKSGWVACAIWVSILAAMLPGARRRARIALVGLAALLTLSLAAVSLSQSVASFSGQRGASAESYVRVGYWIAAADMARENPFGVGVGNYAFHFPIYAPLSWHYEYQPRLADAHSTYLEAVAETGIVGGALFLAFVASLMLQALRAVRGLQDAFLASTTWGVAAAFGVGATMHLTYSYFYFPFEWTLAGLLGSIPAVLAQVARTRP